MPAVTRDNASADEIVSYISICYETTKGIDNALSLLNIIKVNPNTSASELSMISYEYGDQIAKKSRVFSQLQAFLANQVAMNPPSPDMTNAAGMLSRKLDNMIAANIQAGQVIVTSTELFRIWQNTEVLTPVQN